MAAATSNSSGNLPFVSLFSGAGGLDIGFEEAGWSCQYASDIHPPAVDTLQANQQSRLANTYVERADVSVLTGRTILAKSGRKKGDIVAVVGGPPCQSWSSAGHQRGFDDPRGQLFRDYVRIAAELDVRWLVFENVRGLLTARGPDGVPGSALELIRRALLQAGFQTEVDLLNAADYGVPQRRVRLCMIGYRSGDRPPFPEATHTKDEFLFETHLKPWITLGECLSGIAPPTGDEIIRPNDSLAPQLARLQPGSGVKSPGKKETTRPGGHWGYKQGAFLADLNLPARTITAGTQQDWILDKKHGLRRLTPRECAAVQTFPSDWIFAANRAEQYKMIGNAVPPRLAYAIASALRGHVESAEKSKATVRHAELVPLRSKLSSAIRYTIKEELRNGASRLAAPSRRRIKER